MQSIDSPFDSKLTIFATAGAVLLTVLAVWYWQGAATPDPGPSPQQAHAWDGPVGPGLANGQLPELPPLGADPGAIREPGLKTDAAGHIVADLALRQLMDSFLARGQASGRAQRAVELRVHLKDRLSGPAAAEADRLVTQYLDYLDTQDRMLARARLPASTAPSLSEHDVEQLLAFQDQRAQIRQRMLGTELAQAWFATDDSNCDAALHEWQKQHVEPDPSEEPDPVELRERRIHGAALEARRDIEAQVCAAQMSRGFAAGG